MGHVRTLNVDTREKSFVSRSCALILQLKCILDVRSSRTLSSSFISCYDEFTQQRPDILCKFPLPLKKKFVETSRYREASCLNTAGWWFYNNVCCVSLLCWDLRNFPVDITMCKLFNHQV